MKAHQRLDYNRLAEALGERGLVEPDALQLVLNQSLSGSGLFTEILVTENHISDWDLARVVCEVFNLSFLTPDYYTPSPAASEGLDPLFLHQHALVPLDRFKDLVTIAMPALTPTQVLSALSEKHGINVLPVVSCVESNRRYLHASLPLEAAAPSPAAPIPASEPSVEEEEAAFDSMENLAELGEDWGNLFDEGDAAVLLELEGAVDDEELENLPELPELG